MTLWVQGSRRIGQGWWADDRGCVFSPSADASTDELTVALVVALAGASAAMSDLLDDSGGDSSDICTALVRAPFFKCKPSGGIFPLRPP